jgi:hypothetical protein
MRLKKTDYIVISVLIVVVIAGIVGVILAINLMSENNEKERQKRIAEITGGNSVENENGMINGVDVNAAPDEQMKQLVNSIPESLQNKKLEPSMKSIKIKYAYGYDVSLAEEQNFIDVLEIDCVEDDLTSLRDLIDSNKIDAFESNIANSNGTYYNTKIIMDYTKTLSFSDKNASYTHDNRTTYVTLSDDLLKKVGEIVNREVAKHVTAVNANDIKSVVVTNSNNASVTITDAEDIKNICTLSSCVPLNKDLVDFSKETFVYTVNFDNGTKMEVTKDGSMGYMMDVSKQTKVKFMFNTVSVLDSIFSKYAK